MMLENVPAFSIPGFIFLYVVFSVSTLNLVSLLSLVQYNLFSALNKKWLFGDSKCTKGSTVKGKSLNMVQELVVSQFNVFPTLISV